MAAQRKPGPPGKLPRAQRLDRGVTWERDAATGELRVVPEKPAGAAAAPAAPAPIIRARVRLVEVGCNVLAPDGAPVQGLMRNHFRLFEDGAEQTIAHFDAASEPASIVLVLDASPSVYRELGEMRRAARSLAEALSPRDEVAVVAFAGETDLLIPFSRERVLLERAIASPELARVANSRQSNIYQAVFLAGQLFREPPRPGRKAIVLLTDGQDSGLGLSWDPASAVPQAGQVANRLTFEDVARELAAAGVEVYAISTQPRPRAMSEAWLEAHRGATLVTREARRLGMPHYTVYLAELVRRAGGRLYFLSEVETLSKVYRRIAETLGAQYTLGYYPASGEVKPGWHDLRVEVVRRSEVRITHRAGYYVPASP